MIRQRQLQAITILYTANYKEFGSNFKICIWRSPSLFQPLAAPSFFFYLTVLICLHCGNYFKGNWLRCKAAK